MTLRFMEPLYGLWKIIRSCHDLRLDSAAARHATDSYYGAVVYLISNKIRHAADVAKN